MEKIGKTPTLNIVDIITIIIIIILLNIFLFVILLPRFFTIVMEIESFAKRVTNF